MTGLAYAARRPTGASSAGSAHRRASSAVAPLESSVLELQRLAGNGAVTEALGHGPTDQASASANPARSADRAQELIDAAVAIATDGRTALLPEDVRDTLGARQGDAGLAADFDAALARVDTGTAEMGPIAPLNIAAGDVIMALERRFIFDKKASTLDLLGERRSRRYRNFTWDRNDFPDGTRGPNEARAKEMIASMAEVRPERRPNSTKDRVVGEGEVDRKVEKRIQGSFKGVEGQGGHKLHPEAAASFVRMRAAAKAEGVSLFILDANRPFEAARARAAKADNNKAIGDFSSHCLGLAVDLRMSNRRQRFREVDTSPFQNVVDAHAATAHKWMLFRGEAFGWYPYLHEPWHWEYNPPGFRAAYREWAGLPPDPEEEVAGAAGTTPDGKAPTGVDQEETSAD